MTYLYPDDAFHEHGNSAWDDIRVPMSAIKVGAAKIPDFGTFGTDGLLTFLLRGDAGAPNQEEQVYFTAQVPHKYEEATDVEPHVHWTPTNADAGNVRWSLEYIWFNEGGGYPGGGSTTIHTTNVVNGGTGTAWIHSQTDFATITGTGMEISSMFVCRLFRDSNHADDTYGSDVALLEFDFHFMVNSIGSLNEHPPKS